ncbi:MAG: hypothetical protein K0R54_83 [Clostridiaceae bacterium]|jgi:hypothetical protein|nr:hypothetical protein [Clostridiaceae bacterium]
MKFRFKDIRVETGNVKIEKNTISKLSGNEIEKLTLDLNILSNDSVIFQDLLKELTEGEIYSLTEGGYDAKEFKLINSSYIYSNDNSLHRFILNIEQVEKLNIQSLTIAGIEVIPYEYTEEYDNGIIINAKFKINKENSQKLHNNLKDTYFDVIRKGISNEVKIMRFGQTLWSDHGDYKKYNVTIVEKCYDDFETILKHGFLEPAHSNIMRMLAHTINLNNELINLLKSNNTISEADLEDIKEKAKNDIDKTYNEYFKVEDIDKW